MQVFSNKENKPHAYPFLRPSDSWEQYVSFEPIEFALSDDGKSWHSIYDEPDLQGVYCYMHTPAPVAQEDNLEKIGLQNGQTFHSSSYSTREMTMEIHFKGVDEQDASLAYSALEEFMDSRDPYWIAWQDWPQRMYYVRAKLAAPTYTGPEAWNCQVTLTDLYGLSRSIGTTAGLETGTVVKGFGNNEPEERPAYEFTSGNFTVLNYSSIMIDPERRNTPLTIKLDGSATGDMTITNATTGDSITRHGAWSGSWELDDVNPMLNGNHDGINTDHGFLTLQKDLNNISVSGFSGKVTFDFPLWWKV